VAFGPFAFNKLIDVSVSLAGDGSWRAKPTEVYCIGLIVMKFDSTYRSLLTCYVTVILGTDSTDSPHRLPILLSLSVFTFYFSFCPLAMQAAAKMRANHS